MIFQEVFSPVDEMPELTEERAREMREKYETEGPQLPPIERPEPGFWSGMGEGIYRGTASGALKSMSFAETAIANTGLVQSARNMAQVETGETFDQIDVSDVQNRLERDAKQYREIAKRDFAADPSTMGTAAQILHGVFETIPKAVAYSTIAGPAGGSVLFGADLGVSRAQELMDEGVDQNTATWAGIATFGMSALGMRVPAVFGKSRIASATIGAAVNAGLTAAETQSVNWILQNQNYTELAERYRLNPIDLITSAVFGGVMGGVLWRARPDVSTNQADANTRPALNDHLYNQLREASPTHITDEQVRYQADLHAVGIGALASKADIDPYAIAPEIVRGETVGFSQRAFHGSPHVFDTFSTEHIGTGEGAQAHGWGLYFAENKKVADAYRSRLSDSKHVIGRVFEDLENSEVDVFSYMDNDEFDIFLREIDGNKFSDKTTEFLKALNDDGWLGFDRPTQAIREALSGDLSRYEHGERLDSAVKNLASEGRVFEVDIPEQDVLLDEDAPFKDQPQKVKEAVEQVFDKYKKEDPYYYRKSIPEDFSELDENYRSGTFTVVQRLDENRERVFAIFNNEDTVKQRVRLFNEKAENDNPTKPSDTASGRGIYQMLSRLTGSARNASLALNEAGVKGITYHGLRDGRCYVVFDDNAIQTIDFYQRQNSQTTAEQKLQKDVVAWNKLIDELEAVPKQTVLMLNQTPLVMHMVGADFKKLYATPHMFERLFNSKDGSKGSFGKNELKQIPQALTDPIAIFDQDNGRKLFLLDLQTSNGSPVVVPVEFNAQKDFATVNLALTAFAKEKNGKSKFGWIKNLKGKELYVNTKKLTSLNTSAGADSLGVLSERSINEGADNSSVTKNVLTEDDLVKEREKYPGMYQGVRGSFNPALNRITLTANADISTFSHEMGHFYLTDMFELSKLPAAANSTLKEDVDILLKEWGIKSLREWDELGIEGQRKYHEQFASWVEDYLTKGQSPIKELQRLFERMAQWICDVYRTVSLSKRYKDEFGIELPPPSKEVQKVLDRLFREDKKIQKAKQSVNKTQVAAARMVQANRTNENRLDDLLAMPEGPKKTKLMRDQMRSYEAQAKVLKQMLRGQAPDAYEEVKDIDFDSASMKEVRGNFGRAYVMGNTDSVVILQNRDRSDTASQGQMNSIAANPRYGLVSVSRDYAGAPVISYGQAPDNAHLGNSDFIYESNGNHVPFVYAVVEASDVETSNFINGGTNNAYGDKNRWNAVIGNGRMTGLKEAYNRGTASEYRRELEADKGHGISPEVIKAMENPVLVRVINPEDVTTGLISRSNASQVMERDDVEVAFEDAPKIRARAGSYEFDEAGNPTRDTLVTFIQDINDTNALGRLITSDGRPTPEAVRRIRNAVFFEAYQSPELSALFSQEVDPGIRRVLNGLANVAPRIIELREQAQELDFSNLLVEAANRIRQARLNPDEGVDFASQMSFLDNPATSAFVEFLNDNANSAAAIARTLNPLIDWAENAARAAEGDDLLGGFEAPHIDLADVVGQLRNIINEDRLARNLEPLPEINIEDVRSAINSANDAATRAVEAAAPVRAKMEAQQAMDADVANQTNEDLAVKRELSEKVLDPNTQQEAMMELFADQVPDREYTVLDDLGQEKNGTAQQLLAEAELGVIKAQQDRLGIGRVTECLIRNQGV